MIREALIAKARYYHQQGIPLPLDLYLALLDEGVDAKQYDYPQTDYDTAQLTLPLDSGDE